MSASTKIARHSVTPQVSRTMRVIGVALGSVLFSARLFGQGEGATGACCLPLEEVGCDLVAPDPACIITTEADCLALGGVYVGDDVPCEQSIFVVTHSASEFSHKFVTVYACDELEAAGQVCVDGPYKVDSWTTGVGPAGGSTTMNFQEHPIPAGFFGKGSEAFDGEIDVKGEPLGVQQIPEFPDPIDFGEADTLVRRSADPFDLCVLPTNFPSEPVEVDIELIALNLRSCEPTAVTFDDGSTKEYNVAVDLSVQIGQPGGVLTAIKTHCNGGTFVSIVEVCPRFTFTNVKDPRDVVEFDYCAETERTITLVLGEESVWVHNPSQNVGQLSPVCSTFNPGVDVIDPSTKCDCNQNHVYDACDPLGDLDGDGVVGTGDLLSLLGAWGPCDGRNECDCFADIDDDSTVGTGDLLLLLGNWG